MELVHLAVCVNHSDLTQNLTWTLTLTNLRLTLNLKLTFIHTLP